MFLLICHLHKFLLLHFLFLPVIDRGHVPASAADDDDLTGKRLLFMQVDLPHKVDTRHDAVRVAAGDVQLAAGLEAGGHVEALIALLAQLRDGHVFSDLHAAAELDTEFTQDVDLCLHHVFFKAEARNAVHQHAAGTRFPFKHRRAVALFSEAIFSENSPSTFGMTFSGTKRVSAFKSCWAMKRLTSSMATA